MKLSDAFIDNLKGDMEIEVTMLNINYGSNRKLMERCRPLCDYSIFIATVRRYKAEGMELEEAIRRAMDDLPADSPIKNYLLRMEVSMISKWLTAEYSVPRHEEHLRAEGREEGEQRLGALMTKLLSLGKTEDAMKASSDSEYRNRLYKQYGL